MSTNPAGQQVSFDPWGTGPRLGEVVGSTPRTDGPIPDLRVRVRGSDAVFLVGPNETVGGDPR